jgi:hypothetical protein
VCSVQVFCVYIDEQGNMSAHVTINTSHVFHHSQHMHRKIYSKEIKIVIALWDMTKERSNLCQRNQLEP